MRVNASLALVVAVLAFLVAAPLALAAAGRPTLADLEDEVVCPTCKTTLEMSSSPVAQRMRAYIRQRIAAGDSKEEIKAKLVAQFGEGVLAAPPKRGFNLLAWALPLAGAILAAGTLALLARRWLSVRSGAAVPGVSVNGGAPLDPELERRVDEELARFET
ncbi:MAG: cytochrome c-type biogenesis protein CcmH [Thermoleophilia bacterium]|nr:cytochrome c-type biogenesis protein CcmH [Thermoleophilia bacterium]